MVSNSPSAAAAFQGAEASGPCTGQKVFSLSATKTKSTLGGAVLQLILGIVGVDSTTKYKLNQMPDFVLTESNRRSPVISWILHWLAAVVLPQTVDGLGIFIRQSLSSETGRRLRGETTLMNERWTVQR